MLMETIIMVTLDRQASDVGIICALRSIGAGGSVSELRALSAGNARSIADEEAVTSLGGWEASLP